MCGPRHVQVRLSALLLCAAGMLFATGCEKSPDAEPAQEPAERPATLPAGFDNAFMIPDADRDQWGNPVHVRNGSKADPETGYPYEAWLKQPRMEFVLIPAGEFMMGSGISAEEVAWRYGGLADYFTHEHPQHRVQITKPFWLGKYEVTQGQWQAVTEEPPWAGQEYAKSNPRHAVSWVPSDDCQSFISKLAERTAAKVFAFPTEAQWEYACRAGTQTAYSFGGSAPQLKDYAWYEDNAKQVGEEYAHAVGSKRPNAWGLYDMHGNVWEWCADWYGKDYYASSPAVDPTGPASGRARVLRGGGWSNQDWDARCAARSSMGRVFKMLPNGGLRAALRVP